MNVIFGVTACLAVAAFMAFMVVRRAKQNTIRMDAEGVPPISTLEPLR